MAMRRPAAPVKNSLSGTSRLAIGIASVESPMSIASAAITSSRNGAGASSMRPRDSAAAASEPAATPTAKKRLIAISTSMPPPIRDLMMTGRSDSVTAPTVQNQLDADRADPLPVVGAKLADQRPGRGEDVLVDLESRRADAGCGDEARRAVAGERDEHELGDHAWRRAALGRGETAEDEAADDRSVSRALDQRVAGDQLLAPQMIGQNAVFDRAEQRRDHAEPEQRRIEQRRRSKRKAGRGDHLNEDLREFEPPGDQRLVMRIGDLAPERGKRDRGQDEDDGREQDLEARVLAAEAEENEHRQHVADEIVVEGGKELTPEQRREPPRRHQGPEHDGGRPWNGSGWTPEIYGASSGQAGARAPH